LHKCKFYQILILFQILLDIAVSDFCKVHLAKIIELSTIFKQLFEEGSGISLELRWCLSHFLNQLVVREVFESIVNVSALMVDLQQLFCTVQELVVGLHQRFTVSKLLRILDNLIKHRLILSKLGLPWIIILPLHHILNRLPFISILLLLWRTSDAMNFLIKRLDVIPLSSQKFGHVTLKSFHFHLGLSFSHHLEPVEI
jgi:hypothetical protein